MNLAKLPCTTKHPKAYTLHCAHFRVGKDKKIRWKVDKKTSALKLQTFQLIQSEQHICTQLFEQLNPGKGTGLKQSTWKKLVTLIYDKENPNVVYASVPSIKDIQSCALTSNVTLTDPVLKFLVKNTMVQTKKIIRYVVLSLAVAGGLVMYNVKSIANTAIVLALVPLLPFIAIHLASKRDK